jgi:putative ABC transport system substrate-binding protein
MVSAPSPAAAAISHASRTWKIGILFGGPHGSPAVAALIGGLADLSHCDHGGITLLHRCGDGNRGQLPQLAQELVAEEPHVIVAIANEAVIHAANSSSTIPIVSACGDLDFVGLNLAHSLEKPGGNVTGVTVAAGDAARLRVALLVKMIPTLSTVAVLLHDRNPANPRILGMMQGAASERGVKIRPLVVSTLDDAQAALVEAKARGAGAVASLQAPFFYFNRRALCELCMRLGLPIAMGEPFSTEAGALLEVSPDIVGAARASALVVERILKGAQACDLPIECHSILQVAVNLGVAKDLDLTIDPGIARAGVRYTIRGRSSNCRTADPSHTDVGHDRTLTS